MLPSAFVVSDEVGQALRHKGPVVALESTVITHGLPYPENLDLARDMEGQTRSAGAVPATIAVLDGKIHIGLSDAQLARLAQPGGLRKISLRDFGVAVARGESGGTTVAGTLYAARLANIHVFATGGIGGVHRQPRYDVSADLDALAISNLVVVCAGAKAILDLPATVEYLETMGVPIVGYQTDEFPGFYSLESGLGVTVRSETPVEIVEIARAHWELGLMGAILVVVPPPAEAALPRPVMEDAINRALQAAEETGVTGSDITPFLLAQMTTLTDGASLQANLSLLRNNARIAAAIAVVMHPRKGGQPI